MLPHPLSRSSWERFRQLVVDDFQLQQHLRTFSDQQLLFTEILRLSAERGIELSAADLVLALQNSRRAWLERWL